MARPLWSSALAVGEALGGASGAAAWLTYRLKRREVAGTESQFAITTSRSLTETALELLEPVKAAAAEAEAKVDSLQKRVRELEQAVASLIASSQAEREEMQKRLETAEAERDQIAAELDRRNAELNGLRPATPGVA